MSSLGSLHRLVGRAGTLVLLILGLAGDLNAQRSVDPTSGSFSIQSGQSTPVSILLINNDPTLWPADITCGVDGGIGSCSVVTTPVNVFGFSDAWAEVTFTASGEGTGTLWIDASGYGAVFDVTVTPPPPPPPPAVAVSPDGQNISSLPGRERREAFTIANNHTTSLNLSIVAACSGAGIDAASCTASASRIFLRPGESSPVTVRYGTQAAGGSGKVVLRAVLISSGLVLDSGYVNVTASAPSLAIVQIASSTPGVTAVKDQCVNFALRREVSAECGVLRVIHQMPEVRTRGTTRVPTMLYYYDLAYRERNVGIDVTMAPSTTNQTGDSVRVTILKKVGASCVNYPTTRSKTYLAAHWFTGTPGARSRRVTVSVPLENTGNSFIQQYCVDVVRVRSGGTTAVAPTQYGEFAVVQRYDTGFGAGWWLAGLEELSFTQPDSISGANNSILWIGGDGSTRRFRCPITGCAGGKYFASELIDRQDSLTLSGGEYTRDAANGVQVVFDDTGRHIRTVNREGITTSFAYSGASRRLLTITIPPTGSGHTYTFVYDGSNKLIRVDAPGIGSVRPVTVQRSGLAVTGFVDPDNRAVSFLPPGNDPTLIESVVDRRGIATYFYQESASPTVGSVRTELGGGVQQWQYFRTPSGLSARSVSLQPVPDSVGEAYLELTDGRGNVTKLWLDRFGFPTRVVNALGQTTRVERGDPRFAGLVTNTVKPNGHTMSASYDARGNILANYDINPLGDTQDAVTQYHWDLQWDLVDSIITPVGVVTTMDYDNTNGRLAWQQTGSDAARRVLFEYHTGGSAVGLPKGTKLPATPTNAAAMDTLSYDSWGNPVRHASAMGFRSWFVNDQLGRTQETRRQMSVSDSTVVAKTTVYYDIMSRDTMTVAGHPTSSPRVTVRRTLNSAGGDSVVTRSGVPDTTHIGNLMTRTFLDALGRPVKEVAPDGFADSTVYDLGGNVMKRIDRNGDAIEFAYDSLNRLRRRSTALKHFDPEVIGLARGQQIFPDPVEDAIAGYGLSQSYPWDRATGYDIAAQVDTFIYHPADGTLTDANNAFAKVH